MCGGSANTRPERPATGARSLYAAEGNGPGPVVTRPRASPGVDEAIAPGHAAGGLYRGARWGGNGAPARASVTPILTLATHVCLFHRMTAFACQDRAERPAHGPLRP